ncbi:MAG: hypothetical protein K2J77_09530 [Oscillospiraceae bacterium]|nr:hypothetical protein [Oscillospiraceae bacterium]
MKRRNFLLASLAELRRIFLDPRLLTVGMLLVFIYNLVVKELFSRAEKTGMPVNAAETFIAIGSSGILLLFLPSVFLILISDHPNMGSHTLYSIHRSGRLRWLFGEIFGALLSTMIYVVGMFAACTVMTLPHGFLGLEWSDTVTKYVSMFPEERFTMMSQYLPSNLFNQMSLPSALLHTTLLLILYLFSLTLIITLFRILGMKAAGIAAAFGVVAAGVLTCAVQVKAMWAFPMSHTVTWLHYDTALREPIVPMYASYIYFGVFIALGIIANIIAIKKNNINITEDE